LNEFDHLPIVNAENAYLLLEFSSPGVSARAHPVSSAQISGHVARLVVELFAPLQTVAGGSRRAESGRPQPDRF
jgi:hypothetical protein